MATEKKIGKVSKVSKAKQDKVEAVVEAPKAVKSTKTDGFSVAAYSLLGKEVGNIDLPKSVFEGEINKSLLSQAIRVYSNNEKGHFSNTKTRGEVQGSTRKIYKQKGTGRARHGSIMAPIFVGGGIALGPKVRLTVMELPKKMKKAALIAAMRTKLAEKEILGVADLTKSSGKTAEFSKFLKGMQKKTALLVLDTPQEMVIRATRNLKGLSVTTVSEINVFEVIRHQSLFMTKEAVAKLEERLQAKESSDKSLESSKKKEVKS